MFNPLNAIEQEIEGIAQFSIDHSPGPMLRQMMSDRLKDLYELIDKIKAGEYIAKPTRCGRFPVVLQSMEYPYNIYPSSTDAAKFMRVTRQTLMEHVRRRPDGDNKYKLRILEQI